MALLKPSTWEVILEGSPDVTLIDTTNLMESEPTWSASYLNQDAPKFRASDVAKFNRGHTRRRLTVAPIANYATLQAARNAIIAGELEVATWCESSATTVTVKVYTGSGALNATYTLAEAKVTDYSARLIGAKRVVFNISIECGDVTVS